MRASSHLNKRNIVTSADVAKRAGVSTATVSRVFNKNWDGPLRESSRLRVIQAADELGYTPNAIAPILTSGRSNIIAVVVSDTFSHTFSEVCHILTGILDTYGLRTMQFTCPPTKNINDLISQIMQYRVDGVVLTSSAVSHEVDSKWINSDVPVVLFTGLTPDMSINAVQVDNYSACNKVAQLFVGLGHKKIAYFNNEYSIHGNNWFRQTAFLDALSNLGIYDCTICPSDYTYKGGKKSAEKFFENLPSVDAIFCSGNLTQLGVLDAAKNAGYNIGEDLSLVGFYTSDFYDLQHYRITSLKQNLVQMSKDAVNILLSKIEDPSQSTQVITRPMDLYLGDTTPKCPEELRKKLGAKDFDIL